MNARARRLVLTVLCATLGVLAFSVAPAFAGLSFPFDGEFAPSSGSFGSLEANSVAVDDGNDQTYVADSVTGLVTIFNSAHVEVGVLDGGATPAGSFGFGNGEGAVAVNNNTGDVYVLDSADAVVDVFDAAGAYKCQITGSATPSKTECDKALGSATPSGGFLSPRGLAVNQDTGEVYVLDAEHGVIDRFTVAGEFASQVEFSKAPIELSGSETRGLAVNSTDGEIYVGEDQTSLLAVFDSSGAFVEAWNGSNTPQGSFSSRGGGSEVSVAVDDASGRVYVTASAQEVTDVFESSGAYDTQFSHEYGAPTGTAVDQATGEVLVSNNGPAASEGPPAPSVVDVFGPAVTIPDLTTEEATDVTAVTGVLHGIVNPDSLQLTSCEFEYGTTTSYGSSVPCVPGAAGIPADGSAHGVEAEVGGLQPGTTYHFRLRAGNANGSNVGGDVTLLTLPRPVIDSATDANLTGKSVELDVSINPEGSETTYQLQWGLTTSYGNVAPASPKGIGSGTADVLESQHVEGLEANKTYHWRVIATNINGTTTGSDHTFIYDTTTGGGLPDNRAYEMVTPPHKNAALIGELLFKVPSDVSADGSRVIATSIQCLGGAQSCTANRASQGEPYLFTRTPRGWVTTPLAPATSLGENTSVLDSANTGDALFSIATPPEGEDDFYRKTESDQFEDIGPSTAPAFGPLGPRFTCCRLSATPDMSHVVYELIENHWPFDNSLDLPSRFNFSVYEFSGSGSATPELVAVTGGAGSHTLIDECGARLAGERHYLSEDGRIVYVTVIAHDEGPKVCPPETRAPEVSELYARIGGSETVAISRRSAAECSSVSCETSPAGDARFEDASADGSKVFFVDTQQLTDQATEDSNKKDSAVLGGNCAGTVASGCNLYEYDFDQPEGRRLTAISAGDSSGEGPRVQRVFAASADGSHVYFIARGVLTTALNSQGASARSGAENLYCYERDSAHSGGRLVFVARLGSTEEDNKELGQVTSDGGHLVFTSHTALTGDDTSTSEAAQVYEFDAEEGLLARISVGNEGFNDDGNSYGQESCGINECPLDARLAPEPGKTERRDLTMSDDGRYVFFESPVGLTSRALNEVQIGTNEPSKGVTAPVFAQNVYEWHAGHVYLISDGKDVSKIGVEGFSSVKLIGSDASGANVFFATADPLVPGDTDTQLDYYDARICTAGDPCVASAPPALQPCLGEACHGTPAGTPLSPDVPSATFNGEGNITPTPITKAKSKAKPVKCKKGFVKNKKAKCVKNPKKKRAKAKKSVKTNRRAK
jgi:DNA-binding beta-propeller fold protein YncE